MIGVIAKLTVKAGMEDEFEKHAKVLVASVNANEPDCLLYELYKDDENTYVFMEKYTDQAALKTHGQTEYFQAAQAPLGACLAGPSDVKIYKAV